MTTERNVVDFKIHNLTEEQFQELKAQGKIDPNAVYCTPDESLKVNQITNCITEISQDIQIQPSGTTLTLKAGSKVYVPNGTGVFNTITISEDISNTGETIDAFVITNGRSINWSTSAFSGTTAPSAPVTGTIWYDTANNLVKRFSSGSWVSGYSLPVALFNSQDNSKTKPFNGFGYIGGTVFVLPDVKGFIPNGRNEDGTLNNVSITTQKVIVTTKTADGNYDLVLDNNFLSSGINAYFYDKQNNINTWYGNKTLTCYIGSAVMSGGKFVSLTTKTAFHAVDYSDFESTVEEINSSISDTVEEINSSISAVDSSVVHKTGNETIGGVKTFTGYIKASAGVGVQIEATSHSFNLRSSGATPEGCGLFVDNNAAKTVFSATDTKITIGSSAVAPHSVTPTSNSNSTNIATTAFVKSVLSSSGNGLATFSKAQNGYYKFNNGLIIQWGRIQYPNNMTITDKLTLTFPTPFSSSSSYSVTATTRSSINETYARGHTSITSPTDSTVDFRTSNAEYTAGGYVFWIAIGY